jgi:hypothetical protein
MIVLTDAQASVLLLARIGEAALAQLDRASVYGTEGCRFDSCKLHLI